MKQPESELLVQTAGNGKKSFWHQVRKYVSRDWQLYLMILVPIIYVAIFSYGPMYGVQIAFKNYRAGDGIWGSQWVGLKWFKKFLSFYRFDEIFLNTLILSVYDLAVSFPLPIFFALILNTIRNKRFKKTVQTISYMPHFISVTILVGIIQMVFSPVNGVYGNLYRLFGGVGFPTDFRGTEEAFRHLYVWSGIWQGVGWGTILYTAALSAVPPELHEAATIDGASRWKRIFAVDLPTIMPTVAIKLIMCFGGIVSVGFEKVYLMQTVRNTPVSDVIATYTYTAGMGSVRDFSYGAAVGLFNSAINLSLMMLVNWIVKKVTDREVSMF